MKGQKNPTIISTMKAAVVVLFGIFLASVMADPELLQDVCVADLSSGTSSKFLHSLRLFFF